MRGFTASLQVPVALGELAYSRAQCRWRNSRSGGHWGERARQWAGEGGSGWGASPQGTGQAASMVDALWRRRVEGLMGFT